MGCGVSGFLVRTGHSLAMLSVCLTEVSLLILGPRCGAMEVVETLRSGKKDG